MLRDLGAERAVIAGVYKYGQDAFIDICDIVDVNVFSEAKNGMMFRTLEQCFENGLKDIDLASFASAAQQLGYYDSICKAPEDIEYIRSLAQYPILLDNVRSHGKKLKILQVANEGQAELKSAHEKIQGITGTESLSSILAILESPSINIIEHLSSEESDGPKAIGDGIDEYIDEAISNPVDQIGIPTPWPIFNSVIGGGLRTGVSLVVARKKALKYGSKIYTPKGPVNIENIKVGDKICHPTSITSTVEEVFDFTDQEIYRVYLRDGDFVDCCEDHIWSVRRRGDKKNQLFNKDTKFLYENTYYGKDKRYRWDIDLTEPTTFDEQETIIDPYSLGVLIGDGGMTQATAKLFSADLELVNYIKEIFGDRVKHDWTELNNKAIHYRVNGLQKSLRDVGLWGCNSHTKFIPKEYIYNSIQVRLQILRGLMDTDGCCHVDKKTGTSRSIYATVSCQLALDVKEIVQSLGGLCSIVNSIAKLDGKEFPYFRCEVRIPKLNMFRLSRKADKVTPRKIGRLKRTITKIEKVGVSNARCIRISNDNGLFLTDNYVITHNCGKSIAGKECAVHVAGKLRIPVLYIDTEMDEKEQRDRTLASIANVSINLIETGKYGKDKAKLQAVRKAAGFLKGMPFYHQNVSGKQFEEIRAIIKRWIHKHVGLGPDGKANPHLVIYDYFKLMDDSAITNNIAEYQALGFQISKLSDFCKTYNTPVLAFTQANREGEVSQSDRLSWLAIVVAFLRSKTNEEIGNDGVTNGNRKLEITDCRFGKPLDQGDYIHMNLEGEYAQLKEIGTKSASVGRTNTGFPVNQQQDDDEVDD